MQHAAILHIAVAADPQHLVVAAQDRAEPDAGVLIELHIADDLGTVGHPRTLGELRHLIVELVDGHDFTFVDKPIILRMPSMPLRQRALEVLCIAEPGAKAREARALFASIADHPLDSSIVIAEPAGIPGRPQRPALVPPKEVPTRSPFTREGRAALLHAIAHIEFNAINLALDAAWRFAGMPDAFYRDWLRVASEEALHFSLLREHLQSLGCDYGDFDAHDGLWMMTQRTAHDIVARMALGPR